MVMLGSRFGLQMDQFRERAQQHHEQLSQAIWQHCHKLQTVYTKAKTNFGTNIRDNDFHPKAALYAVLVIITTTWLAITLTRRLRDRKGDTPPSTPNLEKRSPFKAPERPFGGITYPCLDTDGHSHHEQTLTTTVWPPQSFKRPTPPPYPNWSLQHTKPLPYRPFRHGPKYNITMGLRTLHWDDWIELDNAYTSTHALKARRIKDRGTQCCRTAPEAYAAALELLHELVDYLPARYPTLYRRTSNGMTNLATNEVFNITSHPLPEDPMATAARMIQDDIAIMLERPDGQYYLLAGCILLAGFWRLQDKFGMPLSEIHTSGDVPGFKEKLEKGMLGFFRRMKPQGLVGRSNYFIQVDGGLAWSESIGREDGVGEGIGWGTAEKDKAIEHHWFRSERQSLRRYVFVFGLEGGCVYLFESITVLILIKFLGCLDPAVSSSLSERTSTPSPISARSRMCHIAWPAPSGAGATT